MQTVDGGEAGNICKAEFQAFMRYFVEPLVMKKLRRRLRHENAMSSVPTYEVRHAGMEDAQQRTLQQICDYWEAELNGAYVALVNRQWYPHHCQGGKGKGKVYVPRSAYKPTCFDGKQVFFASLDNAGAHSHWLDDADGEREGHEMFPGVPLLQRVTMPPQGHDAHQVVEHAIGAIKGFIARVLACACRNGELLTCSMLYDAAMKGAELYDDDSLDRNLVQLYDCLRVIAAEVDEVVELKRMGWIKDPNGGTDKVWGEKVMRVRGTAGGFPPKCLA